MFSRESVWSFITGKLPENTPPSVLHGIRELEMWMLRLLSAPVPVPGKTRVEVCNKIYQFHNIVNLISAPFLMYLFNTANEFFKKLFLNVNMILYIYL